MADTLRSRATLQQKEDWLLSRRSKWDDLTELSMQAMRDGLYAMSNSLADIRCSLNAKISRLKEREK